MGKAIIERFDSIEKLMNTLRSRNENNDAMKGENDSNDKDEHFTKTKSLDEAYGLLENGWEEKLPEVKAMFDVSVRANANTTRSRMIPKTGVVGYAPCVPNAILGLPNSMICSERTPMKTKAVSIVYGGAVSGSWGTKEIMKAGIVAMSIVNSLELQGYRVKLVQEISFAKGNNTVVGMYVDLKDYRQQLDLKKLCFPIVHPSMLRRIYFKWLETVPNLKDKGFRGGYGVPETDYEKHGKDLHEEYNVIGEKDYYISAYMVKDCKYDVKKVMERAGIKISA